MRKKATALIWTAGVVGAWCGLMIFVFADRPAEGMGRAPDEELPNSNAPKITSYRIETLSVYEWKPHLRPDVTCVAVRSPGTGSVPSISCVLP